LILLEKDGWYFEDEGEKHGPFRTRKEAEEAFEFYDGGWQMTDLID